MSILMATIRPHEPLSVRLNRTFNLLYQAYRDMDKDCSGTITYEQLVNRTDLYGFEHADMLETTFAQVDRHNKRFINFKQFLVLMFLWTKFGTHESILGKQNGKGEDIGVYVTKAIKKLWLTYLQYDKDHNQLLTHENFDLFIEEQLPELIENDVIAEMFPESMPQISFSRLMVVLSKVYVDEMCEHDDPHIKTLVTHKLGKEKKDKMHMEGSHLWDLLEKGFRVLEKDFALFDTRGRNCLQMTDLLAGIQKDRPDAERVDHLARIEYNFTNIDVDGNGYIDFWEFLYLGLILTKQGSYKDLVFATDHSSVVKRMFISIYQSYTTFTNKLNHRMHFEELAAFFQKEMGVVPKEAKEAFDRLISSREKPHIDVLRFMRILYQVVVPDGRYLRNIPNTSMSPSHDNLVVVSSVDIVRIPRVSTFDPSEVKKINMLGKGSQGEVWRAEWKGYKVAFKEIKLKEASRNDMLQEFQNEVSLMSKFDHPNFHWLITSCVKPTMLWTLTELCDNGSLFDCYMQKRMRFDIETRWRMARECAVGLDLLHSMKPPFMHRDIKSLNILLDSNFTAKIADFGYAKDPSIGENSKGVGTLQWCAPEVLCSKNYDERCDLYSYGILLWEIIHLKGPYFDLKGKNGQATTKEIIYLVLHHDLRPEINPFIPEEMSELMQQCWSSNPAERPRCKEIIRRLDAMKSEFEGKQYFEQK